MVKIGRVHLDTYLYRELESGKSPIAADVLFLAGELYFIHPSNLDVKLSEFIEVGADIELHGGVEPFLEAGAQMIPVILHVERDGPNGLVRVELDWSRSLGPQHNI